MVLQVQTPNSEFYHVISMDREDSTFFGLTVRPSEAYLRVNLKRLLGIYLVVASDRLSTEE